MLPTGGPPQNKRPTQTESGGLEKKYSKQMDRKRKAGVAIPISDKIVFKTKAITRDREGHFIILKGRIHQEDINIINIYVPNIRAPKYIKKFWRISRKIQTATHLS